MGSNYSLCCKETGKSVEIARRSVGRFYLYTNKKTLKHLEEFLFDHAGKDLFFEAEVSSSDYDDYTERNECFEERRKLQDKIIHLSLGYNGKLSRQAMIIRWFANNHKFKNGVCPWCLEKDSHKENCMYIDVVNNS